ncbi:hypothetical protein [Methylobacterium sp. Gmos1]
MILAEDEKVRLRAISQDRSRPLKHVPRIRVVLLSAEPFRMLEVTNWTTLPAGATSLVH